MDVILFNGIVKTMDKNMPDATAVAMKNGIIEAVGTCEDILKLKTNSTKVIDLQGKLVVPGLNDSHLHNLKYAFFSKSCFLGNANSLDCLVNTLTEFKNDKNVKDGNWIVGRGWNQDYFVTGEKVFPSKQDLDKVSLTHPIIAYRACGHSVVLNSKGMEVLGIDENTPPVEGADFNIETGTFFEAATDLAERAFKTMSVAELKEYFIASGKDLLKQGITSIQSDDFGMSEDYDRVVQAYSELSKEGNLPVRVYQQCLMFSVDMTKEFLAKNYTFESDPSFYKLGPTKLLADGSLGARTANLRKPYADDPTATGICIFTQEQLDEIVKLSHDAGRSVAVHCIGDNPVVMTMDAVRKAQKANPKKDMRHGIVHCQIEDIPLIEMYKELDMVAYIQPIFLHYDMHILEDRVGKELAATSYNFNRMKKLGIHAAFGTDSPVEPFETMPNIYCAVTRKDLKGFPEGGFYPSECMSIEDAVYGYTMEGAYCSFEENVKGSITKGKYADFTVIEENIFEIDPIKIKDAKIAMTIVNGKVVYEA